MNLVNFYTSFHDPIWVIILSAALFFPVRKLIWVLYVRKKQKAQSEVSEEEKISLKNAQILLQYFYVLFLVIYM